MDETGDMTRVNKSEEPTEQRVRELANLSAAMDTAGTSSRLAIIAPDKLAYGLGQMYGARRA